MVDDAFDLEGPALAEYAVRHERPPAEPVLRRHLGHLLGDETSLTTEGPGVLHHPDVRRALAEEVRHNPSPALVVDLAVHVATVVLAGGEPPTILAGLATRLAGYARELFTSLADDDGGATQAGEPRRSGTDAHGGMALRDRAFVLAAAVLDGFPLGRVAAAADRLAGLLHEFERPGAPMFRPAFSNSVLRCQPHVRIDGGRRGLHRTGWTWTRIVRLRNPAFADAVLDVVWQELDTAHQPVLRWLTELAEGADMLVRTRAALTVGKLATYDFEQLDRAAISRWASAHELAHNRIAALALEAAAMDDRLVPVVRQRLREWARTGGAARQRTAILAYGTDLGVRFLKQALLDLRALAEDARHRPDDVIALTVARLFAGGREPAILAALVAWANDPAGRAREQAARCLLRLAERRSDMPGRQPALLAISSSGPDLRAAVSSLWKLALAEPATADRAWTTLADWVRLAEDDDGLRQPLADLADDLATEPWLRHRLRFYLWQWRRAGGAHTTVERLPGGLTQARHP